MRRYRLIVIFKNNRIMMKQINYADFEKWYAKNHDKIKEVKLEKINS